MIWLCIYGGGLLVTLVGGGVIIGRAPWYEEHNAGSLVLVAFLWPFAFIIFVGACVGALTKRET
jgi:hypothetical protein